MKNALMDSYQDTATELVISTASTMCVYSVNSLICYVRLFLMWNWLMYCVCNMTKICIWSIISSGAFMWRKSQFFKMDVWHGLITVREGFYTLWTDHMQSDSKYHSAGQTSTLCEGIWPGDWWMTLVGRNYTKLCIMDNLTEFRISCWTPHTRVAIFF